MSNQLPNVAYMPHGLPQGWGKIYEYNELIKSLKRLIAYVEDKRLAENINSFLRPCVEKLKKVLIKVSSVIEIYYKDFDYLTACVEKLIIIIKLFSKAIKLSDAIERLNVTSKRLMERLIDDVPKSTEPALKKFARGNPQGLTINAPFYIASEAISISKNNLLNIGKELEYVRIIGSKSMIHIINDRVNTLKEERILLERIKEIAFKVSEQYTLLIDEAEKTIGIIEEEISGLNIRVDKFIDCVIRRPVVNRSNNKFKIKLTN